VSEPFRQRCFGLTAAVVAECVAVLIGGPGCAREPVTLGQRAGESSQDAGSDAGPCTRATCESLQCACGTVADGCGGWLACGTCPAPSVCDDGACACAPSTCAQLGASCGVVPDGCGGRLDCGACREGETCGAAGPNVCGVGECTAAICAEEHCGELADGCGAVLACGGCRAPATCGGGGAPNACGCAPLQCVAGVTCGVVPDGCGGEALCGNTCAQGSICNTITHLCCVPAFCASDGPCHRLDDGCGNVLDCGECAGW
jgi:hypothetical protein